MKKNSNEPFHPYLPGTFSGSSGISTREYYAILALQGLLAGGQTSEVARRAVELADKLIIELDE